MLELSAIGAGSPAANKAAGLAAIADVALAEEQFLEIHAAPQMADGRK